MIEGNGTVWSSGSMFQILIGRSRSMRRQTCGLGFLRLREWEQVRLRQVIERLAADEEDRTQSTMGSTTINLGGTVRGPL